MAGLLVAGPQSLSDVAGAQENGATSSAQVEARGLVRSPQRIAYRSEIMAPVKSASFLTGQSFKEGDVLIEMDCSRYEAEERAARASAHAANIEYKTQKRLHSYQAAGKNEVDLAAARASEARAQLQVHEERNQACSFEAPFSGRVVELNVMPHEFPSADKPMIVVIDDTTLEIELVVPSKWLNWLRPGTGFEIVIDETGDTGHGEVERIAAEVDPVSQTIKIVAKFVERPTSVLAGMSGSVKFERALN